jgi:NAD(P)-dependent dehydrogenase (short-subunit alcohol dehydrogenase family)
MDLKLTNKLALISASTKGIGFAIASKLAEEGASVIINGRTKETVDAAINGIKAKNPQAKLFPAIGDLSSPEGFNKITNEFPSCDILINNLGIYYGADFFEQTDEEWTNFFHTNVLSGIRLARFYLKKMLEQKKGRVIFISSESGLTIPPDMIAYAMTKTAQISIARGLAKLTKGTEVTVNSLLPGPTHSNGVDNFLEFLANEHNTDIETAGLDLLKRSRSSSLIERIADAEEVANMAAFLASPLSALTNGASIRVEGGIVDSL